MIQEWALLVLEQKSMSKDMRDVRIQPEERIKLLKPVYMGLILIIFSPV